MKYSPKLETGAIGGLPRSRVNGSEGDAEHVSRHGRAPTNVHALVTATADDADGG